MLGCKGLTVAFTFLRVKLSVAEPYLQGERGRGGRAVLCVCACVCVCVCVRACACMCGCVSDNLCN